MSNTEENTQNQKTGGNSVENIEIKNLENSEVEINAEIPTDEFEAYREEAMKSFAEKAEIDGFRKGNAPEKILEEKFGQAAILEEMAQKAISLKYPQILSENKVDAIGQPEVTITKLAKGSPLGFKIKTAVLPQIDLPEYKKVAAESAGKEEEITITEKEVEDVITNIRQQRAQKNESEQPEEKEGEEKTKEKKKEEELPELTDEVAKELGFDGVEDLKSIIRDNLKQEKEAQARDKKRGAILEALTKETKIDLPTLVVENELERMMAQLKGEISNMGMTFENYLEHVGKSEADLREASKPDAEKRAKSQLIINKIATLEDIQPQKEMIESETQKLIEKYDDADPQRSRAYVEMVLTNEEVLKFLEEQADGKKADKPETENKKSKKEGEERTEEK